MSVERDSVHATATSGDREVPLVRTGDTTYLGRDAIMLVNDEERVKVTVLSRMVDDEIRHNNGTLNRRERLVLYGGLVIVATSVANIILPLIHH